MSEDGVASRTPKPGGKPTRVERWTSDAVRAAVPDMLSAGAGRAPFGDVWAGIAEALDRQHDADEHECFGSAGWSPMTLKLEPECRGKIGNVAKATPQPLRRTV